MQTIGTTNDGRVLAVLTQADLTALEYSEGELHIRMERAAARPAAPQPLNMSPIAAEPTLPVEEKNDFNNLCDRFFVPFVSSW